MQSKKYGDTALFDAFNDLRAQIHQMLDMRDIGPDLIQHLAELFRDPVVAIGIPEIITGPERIIDRYDIQAGALLPAHAEFRLLKVMAAAKDKDIMPFCQFARKTVAINFSSADILRRETMDNLQYFHK